jgi:hypothetical protein
LTDEDKRAKIIEIINREEGIAMAVDTLVKVTKDEIEYARMTTLLKSELDRTVVIRKRITQRRGSGE